ncbi:MAG: hypothetical protein KF819_17900 [Labilithrix sp.]|nr:hypothetical protein [Labilithrix sp.]
MPRRPLALAALLTACLVSPLAHAQDKANAEALFQKGRKLFDEKNYAEACPSFAESYRLDPVSGALLALAACHEAEGKLATAWAEYVDVVGRARREGKEDRATAARERAASLEPKLAKITISVTREAAAIQGLELRRDGFVVGAGSLGAPLPVDRGEHVIQASAPGRKLFVARVTVDDGAATTVSIPALEPASEAAPTPADPAATAPVPASERGSPLRTAGLVTGAAGLVALGFGTYFGVTAIAKNNESNVNCNGDVCNPTGKVARLDALNAGNTSTVLFVVGSLLAAGGVALYIVGGSSSREPKTAIVVTPVGLGGSFR